MDKDQPSIKKDANSLEAKISLGIPFWFFLVLAWACVLFLFFGPSRMFSQENKKTFYGPHIPYKEKRYTNSSPSWLEKEAEYSDSIRLQIAYLGRTNNLVSTIVDEQALLFDTTPLYLPTVWNFVQNQNSFKAESFAGSDFLKLFSPIISLENRKSSLMLSFERDFSSTSYDLLKVDPWEDFSLFGYKPILTPVFDSRVALVRVRNYEYLSQPIYQQELTPQDVAFEASELWKPAIFSLQIDSLESLLEPVKIQSTGNSNLDQLYRDYILQFPWLPTLGEGYYQIEFCP